MAAAGARHSRHVSRRAREADEKPFQLLVIDEYHWLADAQRGNHYEGVLLSAPAELQLLLLSGAGMTLIGLWAGWEKIAELTGKLGPWLRG